MSAPIDVKKYQAAIEALKIVPSDETLFRVVEDAIAKDERFDASDAPLMVEKLRYTYTKPLETVYPEYAAANGDVLPIDTSPGPDAEEWEYWTIDHTGFADWVGDDGMVMPNGAMTATKTKGSMHEMSHAYVVSMRDVSRAAANNIQLSTVKQTNAIRVHAVKTNWVWLFGEPTKGLHGLLTHPNIQVTLAPLSAAGTYGDNRDRLIQAKTNEEVLADIEDLIELVPRSTIRAHFVATVYMPYSDISHLKRRRLGAGDGNLSLWDYIQSNYGAANGEHPAVEFKTLNECDPSIRSEPVLGTDTSGLRGKVWLAIPKKDKEQLAFIRSQPVRSQPPQETDLILKTITLSRIGGCKCQIPMAVHRKDFIAADVATAAA